jgi:ketosteroid isomerase-like protein
MGDNIANAQQFYTAMQNLDPPGIVDALAEDFVLYVAEGMPGGFGGRYSGREAVLDKVWSPVFSTFGAIPYPDDLLPAGEDTVVATGVYRGGPPATERPWSASFAHILRFRDGKMIELRQITDTKAWEQALNQAD